MIISDSKQFIFIHNPKAAGTSIREILHPYATVGVWQHKVNDNLPVGTDKSLSKHVTASKIREYVGQDKWNRYFTFAFIRNPWDLIVSQYLYAKRHIKAAKHTLARGSFTDFISWYDSKWAKNCIQPLRIFPQLHYIGDGVTPIVTFVGRFERMSIDFKKICNRLKINYALPHLNRTKHGHYRTFYTKKTRAIVRRLYGNDIETFGYTF